MQPDLISKTVHTLASGFQTYMSSFNMLTLLAPKFFRERDWKGMQMNHRQRLRLYKDQIKATKVLVEQLLDEKVGDGILWHEIKEIYTATISERKDKELAETFFNSVIRKVNPNVQYSDAQMYIHEGFTACELYPEKDLYREYPPDWGLHRIMRQILTDFDFGVPYMDREKDIEYLVRGVQEVVLSRYQTDQDTTTQVLKNVFYRNKAAYLIGRTYLRGKWMPFIIPFMNGPKGVFADTLIFDPNLMSGIFSFTRSYFMVETAIPSQIVAFLNSVIRHKQIHELYNAIGFNKHGKTEFYREFLNHLDSSEDQFVVAEGIMGMVMTVFTLPSYNIVFKLIKDHFDPPKNMTRQEVREKYKLVSLHDRVGRMADTHEFENFQLPLDRIHPELMDELRRTTNSLLKIQDGMLIIEHLYTERRMIPLNIFLSMCNLEDAKIAVEEYGNAILQLAQANIFPGDMMTKNFGVTRQKRVVFYDYDEIEFLTDMNFREKPKPSSYEQIYAAEPWYDIAKNDVFPEDFKRFMIGRQDVKEYFFEVHQNLFDAAHWRSIQDKIKKGELIHAFPYPENMRFRKGEAT
ncbi:bifunctional isocitrate dehydrogenase kinase/phosphatase [Pararhodonellum marinum]|uniref:bifunctional isocitrate dehydrogenase kinase/phosphatase n=1 Tax=Pararhodonellum marinum TaxID=2755358 RepID=UPI00188F6091|nr:bifunctional isocitrate dehydrogenase kinase/phosphatase [Pararhodonellum marinum]